MTSHIRNHIAFRVIKPTDGSWWVNADREAFSSYWRDEANVQRMNAGSAAPFISGGEGWVTPRGEKRSELVTLLLRGH